MALAVVLLALALAPATAALRAAPPAAAPHPARTPGRGQGQGQGQGQGHGHRRGGSPGAAGASSHRPPSASPAGRDPAEPTAPLAAALPPGSWEIYSEPAGQLFPSLLIASATLSPSRVTDVEVRGPNQEKSRVAQNHENVADHHPAAPGGRPAKPAGPAAAAAVAPAPPVILGDQDGCLGVLLHSPAEFPGRRPLHVRVELLDNPLVEAARFDGELTVPDREYAVLPKVIYKYETLARVHQVCPLNLVFRVTLGDGPVEQKSQVVRVHTVNECLYGYQATSDRRSYQDLTWMFAAYVNEDHPVVREILREAQANHLTEAFDNYQSGEPAQVLRQVFAVWDVLQRKGLSYSDVGTTSSESDAVWSMHVRFLDEVLADRQANCVDACVLLASVLRKVGIRPFLVLKPGHMYLGFDLDENGSRQAYLETTLLGSGEADPGEFHPNPGLSRVVPPAAKLLPSWKVFNLALEIAGADFKKNRRRYDRAEDPDFQLVDVETVRREGLMPVANPAAPAERFRPAPPLLPPATWSWNAAAPAAVP